MNPETKTFCHRYNAELRPSRKFYYSKTPYKVDWDISGDIRDHTVPAETVPGVELTMSQRDFNYLLEMHDKLEELIYRTPDRYRGRGVDLFLLQQQREMRLRNHYPQLKELYEQYQLMLRLVDDGRN